jgi:glutamyl-tRNA synthetase
VIDDVTMRISHVIRGNDHLSNTPKQILMYGALGYPIPQFAHIPLILGSDKTKLSKRHTATAVLAYRDNGYLPEALVNYLVRLGWGYGDQEIFSLQEMIEKFSLEGVGKSAGIFNTEKLLWLNQHYIKETPPERLGQLLVPDLEKKGFSVEDPKWLAKIVRHQQERNKTLVEMADAIEYYFVEDITYQEKAAKKFLKPATADLFEELLEPLEALESFAPEVIDEMMRTFIERHELKLAKVAQPLRVALTGGTASPGIFDVMSLLGKVVVLQRVRQAIRWIRSSQ